MNITKENAQVVLKGQITSFTAGMEVLTVPKQCHFIVELEVEKIYCGSLPKGPLKIILSEGQPPVLGENSVLFGSEVGGFFAFAGQICGESEAMQETFDQLEEQFAAETE
ncbi:hypothetical protein SS50377_20714 [Spironucleus salmonicida]|uniref:Uncharacterized protein n=1 Tax=Spironucleus salmonicida TaxID=348837 RepID=V6M0I6_9EUKA|nr:hypothetical protein SS50377_20714 [Spironucleus salmonicida]|eukprot:EST49556.1 Hypothetical protein SS50377_10170 [Spironucleus salmonicida]